MGVFYEDIARLHAAAEANLRRLESCPGPHVLKPCTPTHDRCALCGGKVKVAVAKKGGR